MIDNFIEELVSIFSPHEFERMKRVSADFYNSTPFAVVHIRVVLLLCVDM